MPPPNPPCQALYTRSDRIRLSPAGLPEVGTGTGLWSLCSADMPLPFLGVGSP
ncbi:hypothetical protein B9Z19DRAFT_1082454 [Tuber borchii]|uniref:Uncharacterized protein n=1 Tax=Tuber borchii TaxID=42251 RepID=A0A2T6ZUF2_TUBBO|nr:hypothetical protein B9Z19DRAFT_1082454 [Tuber borchii]